MWVMQRLRRGLAVVVIGILVWSGLAAASAVAAGPNTTWSMASDYDDHVLDGQRYDYDASSGMVLQGTDTGITGTVQGWQLSLEPADGDVLAAGRTYSGATRTPFREPGEPGLELYGNGRGCNRLTGTSTIHEISFTASGELESAVLTFEQHCEGAAAAAYGSIAWHATQPAPALPSTTPAPPVPPTLEVKVAGRRVGYGHQVDVEVRLTGGSTNREVSVSARTSDGHETLLSRASVDATGRLTVPATLTEATTFIARLGSDGTFPAIEASSSLEVSGKLRAAVVTRGSRRGKVHLYRAAKRVTIASRLKPNHAGDCIKFRVQFKVRGPWGHDIATTCLELDRRSVTAVRLDGDPRLIGVPIRIRSEWKGDARNTRTTSRWLFVQFTC